MFRIGDIGSCHTLPMCFMLLTIMKFFQVPTMAEKDIKKVSRDHQNLTNIEKFSMSLWDVSKGSKSVLR